MTATVEELQREAQRLLSLVRGGQEVIVTVHGEPTAKLVPFSKASRARRKAGSLGGSVWLAPDFDAPLPEFSEYR